jgi:hypothetical protein
VLLAEYSWPSYDRKTRHGIEKRGPQHWVIWHVPLAQCFALYAAIAARYGVEPKGPTYVEQEMLKAKRAIEEAVARGEATF